MQYYKRKTFAVYNLIILLVIGGMVSLPYISTTISVKSTGIIRPSSERTQIKAIQSGIIDTLYYSEGATIMKGNTILRIKDFSSGTKIHFGNVEEGRIRQFLNDLRQLTKSSNITEASLQLLQTPLYKEQLSRYLSQLTEQKTILAKATKEYDIYSSLRKDKVISEKEFFDYDNALQRAQANYQSFIREQQSQWYQQIATYQSQLSNIQQQQTLTHEENKTYEVKTPVSGTIQGINTIYTGGVIQAGENICTVSPDADLVAECYLSPKDVGLIKLNQEVIFQIDAFDYNLFGTVKGKVITIDNDFTILEGAPIFKVHCRFNKTQLSLKNGYMGHLKKGLTFQSRFVIGHRTLWQLLWDKMDDWLNPAAPIKNSSK